METKNQPSFVEKCCNPTTTTSRIKSNDVNVNCRVACVRRTSRWLPCPGLARMLLRTLHPLCASVEHPKCHHKKWSWEVTHRKQNGTSTSTSIVSHRQIHLWFSPPRPFFVVTTNTVLVLVLQRRPPTTARPKNEKQTKPPLIVFVYSHHTVKGKSSFSPSVNQSTQS